MGTYYYVVRFQNDFWIPKYFEEQVRNQTNVIFIQWGANKWWDTLQRRPVSKICFSNVFFHFPNSIPWSSKIKAHQSKISALIKFACSTNFSRPLLHVLTISSFKNSKLRLLKCPNLTQPSLETTPKTIANSEKLVVSESSTNCLSNLSYCVSQKGLSFFTIALNKLRLELLHFVLTLRILEFWS